jgi:hypothetical protein
VVPCMKKTTSKSSKRRKSNGFDSLWVSNIWFRDFGWKPDIEWTFSTQHHVGKSKPTYNLARPAWPNYGFEEPSKHVFLFISFIYFVKLYDGFDPQPRRPSWVTAGGGLTAVGHDG